jgi:glycosyltransferase involved in cell wall biosynthesis
MKIAVCSAQVPFARGGTEIFVDDLVAELRKRGHEAELVTVPYKWYPGTRVLTQAFLWRLLDLSEANGQPIDLVIATKFPSYAVRHSNKVVWLLHQFRQAYELDRTELGQFSHSREDRATRRAVQALDQRVLGEARKLFTTSRNNQQRLQSSTGLVAEVLPHPPQELPYRCEDYGDFVLSVSRLDRAKRVDLLIEAAAASSSISVVVAGDGPDRGRLEELAGRQSLDGRVRFLGRVTEDELADLYARCLAVFYAPVDEDFGMVPYEAFLADKPVVTTSDAGGPLEVVTDRKTGIVCEPQPRAVADACTWLREHLDAARSFGRAGHALANEVTWDRAIARILE